MVKPNIWLPVDDIPVIIDALEDSLEMLCDSSDCEDCTLRRATILSFIDTLFKRAKPVKVEF